jgi:hypothetical protein
MLCTQCHEDLHLTVSFTCEDVNGCDCGEGMIYFYNCKDCNVQIEVTEDCKNQKLIEEETN